MTCSAIGFRFFLVEDMCKAIAASSYEPYAHLHDQEDFPLRGDFRGIREIGWKCIAPHIRSPCGIAVYD